MFAVAAVTVMSFGVTPAFAYSINNEVDFDNWSIGSGTSEKTYSNDRCDNEVVVIANTDANTVQFNWNGHSTCRDSFGHTSDASHSFDKVRGSITIDGTTYQTGTQRGSFDYFGQMTINQDISSGDQISVDIHWYYS